jgi:CRP-like cAMP-binding protein
VSNDGKEATIGILGDGEFFGEGALAGQVLRMGSATAMTDCAVLRIDKKAMMEALHQIAFCAFSTLEKRANHDTRGSRQETQQIRSQDIPFDHQRW